MQRKPNSGWAKKRRHKTRSRYGKYAHGHSIKFSAGTALIERIIKLFIYGILRIAIPNYIKSSKLKSKNIVNDTYKKLNSPEFAFIPSGFALYLFMSFIPVLAIVSSIGNINDEFGEILRYVQSRIIPGIDKLIPNFLNISNGVKSAELYVAILFVISALWISSSGYAKFVQSNSILYEHNDLGNIIKNRIKGIWIVICLTIILTIGFLIITSFLYFLKTKAGYHIDSWQFKMVFYVTIPFLIMMFLTMSYMLLYHHAPLFKVKYSQVMPGVLISSIPITIFVVSFGFLISLINYEKFGILSSFMYIQFFLMNMSYFTYMGVLINASFFKTFVSSQTISKKTRRI
ncbi:YhjD/YihY/BrkB family envelope integrity protein [Mycoplasma phocoenae]|uniref:YihY/virulence factor BrkB family protein n=1 Tax=Mycoplasma phocoenae TaxID=754517 RepID=A0A858U3J7_9MOLU|nr:YhjD/YihY/BrkB family envelope integrity protein [Mycoplasma phocoenae]QJG66992.1 YihY/virulence factor BrkB family protein [Mycoplasma phocoenae]